MADVPISQFPEASSANSSDVLAGVQSGATKKFSLAIILAWLKNVISPTDIGAISSNEKGVADGVATLDANGKVPGTQLDLSGKQDKITASGILKGDGHGGVTAATPGTDYGTYSLPSGGIPSSDMASGVQTSLGKADTAYQKPSGGIPATDLASGVIPSVPSISTSTPNMDGTGAAGSTGQVSDAGHTHPSDTTKANQAQLATVESGSTASRAYAVDEYFCWNGLLYRVTAAISRGGTFTPGTNCVTETVGERLGLIKTVLCATGTSANPVNTVIPLKNRHTYLVMIQRVGDQYSSFGLIVQSNGTVWKNDLASGGAYSNRYSVSTSTRTLTITAYLSAVTASIIDFGAYA